MGEYEDRYPEAYGHGDGAEERAADRHFLDLRPARRVRDVASTPPDREVGRRVRAPVEFGIGRAPRQICDDVYEQLGASPFIDATGITVAVTGAEVTLDGATNSRIAVSLARALALGTAGV